MTRSQHKKKADAFKVHLFNQYMSFVMKQRKALAEYHRKLNRKDKA